MKTIKISELKAHISRELRRVRNGERIVVYDRNEPIAELHPYGASKRRLVVRLPKQRRTLPSPFVRTETDPLEYLMEDRNRR